ncbi:MULTISPECIES: flagellar motor switch protein FliN [unclassified Pseudomonas]|uniref:flagellar motor switch protein FliN n=1 Tax=unclassified Pseudomonas TaxID=196821 RepID=UPI000BCF93E6|nr:MULTISPECIES: flagellar motor switch protein FliN [unclassified Pseudomonas]PVZ20497.1 flagellar motor switch protein FliN/FliY [Pseudomonas sp. URIL14HWK12:I12]PVZ27563.1 flagellar motor switch protein FliN/FliY [Pseudomonas sp. URIL14HWK12:I10]PVZ38452.1 flagellar motor switch protein FliN/FliY [Pseudomonas sp. URIL14HWK12:I11]SNZ03296.1 flagellar motor switch protein FliN/FliY [Pseudomonas sp. URIL14HWK12:I9]
MADEKDNVSADDQALADEWAAALNEAGEGGQNDIDALLAADEPKGTRLPMEEFGTPPKAAEIAGLEGPNLDVILDIPVMISMEVGSTEINIRNLLQLNQGSVIELDRLAGEPLDVLVNGTLVAHGEVVVVNEKFGIRLTDVISPTERIKKLR